MEQDPHRCTCRPCLLLVLVSEDETVVETFANRRIEVFVLSLEEYCQKFWSHLTSGGVQLIPVKVQYSMDSTVADEDIEIFL